MVNSIISQNEILSRFGENVYTHAYTGHYISCPNNKTPLKATTLRWQNISCLIPHFTSLDAHAA